MAAQLALALLTGGGSLASKAAQGGRAASRTAGGLDEVADASRGARGRALAQPPKGSGYRVALTGKCPSRG